jgi:6-phosphogluconolactonase
MVLMLSWSRSGEGMGAGAGEASAKEDYGIVPAPMSREVVVDRPEALAAHLVKRFEGLAAAALRERGRFSLALPGGSVATAFLPRLAAAAVDWMRTEVYWSDERAVPPDHPDSNYGLARALWLKDGGPPSPRVFRMEAGLTDPEPAARAYEALLVHRLGSPPVLDAVLLGVGPDGHVCSLFPGHPLLAEETRFVAPVLDSPKAPPHRVTLTLPTLAAARLVVVAAFGKAKAGVVHEALNDPRSPLPLALVLRRSAQALVLLDPAAAGR